MRNNSLVTCLKQQRTAKIREIQRIKEESYGKLYRTDSFCADCFSIFSLSDLICFFIYEYRKYGTFLVTRAVILYSFVFIYCVRIFGDLTTSGKETVAQMTGPKMELHLFASWQHFRDNTVLVLSEPSTYLPAMKQSVFWNQLLMFYYSYHLAFI